MTKILFTPLGMTDPIRGQYDGPMLHICRNYQPDVIYLFMSKEISELDDKDNRYVSSIIKLSQTRSLLWSIDDKDIHKIKRYDLEDVSDFNNVFNTINYEINKILNNFNKNEDLLLLNVTSGSTQISSSLIVWNSINSINCKCVQIKNPARASNYKNNDYDLNKEWLFDLDNSSNTANRCTDVKVNSLKILEVKNTLQTLINSYDYFSALKLVESNKYYFNKFMINFLKHCNNRKHLSIDCIKDKYIVDVYDKYKIPKLQKVNVEYLLSLQIRFITNNLRSFLLCITPIFLEILIQIFNKCCKHNVSDYIKTDSNNIKKWNKAKLESCLEGKIFYKISTYSGYNIDGTFLKSEVFLSFFNFCSYRKAKNLHIGNKKILNNIDNFKKSISINNNDIAKLPDIAKNEINKWKNFHKELNNLNISLPTYIVRDINDIRNIEEAIRNKLAHDLYAIDDTKLQNLTGFASNEIWEKLCNLADYAGIISKNSLIWNTYDKINQFIINEFL